MTSMYIFVQPQNIFPEAWVPGLYTENGSDYQITWALKPELQRIGAEDDPELLESLLAMKQAFIGPE